MNSWYIPLKRGGLQLPKSEGAKWKQEYGSPEWYLARPRGRLVRPNDLHDRHRSTSSLIYDDAPQIHLAIDIAQAPVRPPNIAVVVEEVAELTASVKGKSGEVIMGYTFGPARTKAEDAVWESFSFN